MWSSWAENLEKYSIFAFPKGAALEARPEPRLVPGAHEAARVPLVAQERALHGPRVARRRRHQQR